MICSLRISIDVSIDVYLINIRELEEVRGWFYGWSGVC